MEKEKNPHLIKFRNPDPWRDAAAIAADDAEALFRLLSASLDLRDELLRMINEIGFAPPALPKPPKLRLRKPEDPLQMIFRLAGDEIDLRVMRKRIQN